MSKTAKQIISLLLLVSAFAVTNLAVWTLFTKNYINDTSPEMQARSVEVSRFLPFDESSEIVRTDDAEKLKGDLPRVDGAAALFPVYSAFVHALYPENSVIYENGSFAPDSPMQFRNTRGAYSALANKETDIIFVAQPSAEQLESMKKGGVDPVMVPIGCEAFVFIVSADNPVDDLSVDEVKAIYSGKITKWSEVGGSSRYIDAVQRNKGSGSQTAMTAFMGDVPMKRIPAFLYSGAIGYSFRYYVEGLAGNGKVKILSLNGVYPDKRSIADGSYPVSSFFYAVYDGNNKNENTEKFISFCLSDKGQRIIEESGYVPLPE